jgi:glycerol-3-phosphate O-acyltransferase
VAGINLSFFPLGPIFRGAGAFFMRRTFKDNKIYAEVFSAYLKILLREGYPLEVFIEGGRSRTGRLLLPRMGVVKYLVKAFQELGLRDLYFVPVYIGYDQVIEQGEYLRELKGEKEKGNKLFALLRSWRLIRENYGKIYLNFGEPMSLRKYLEQAAESADDPDSPGFEELGYDLVSEINRLTLATPGGLIACALLSSGRPARRDEELKKAWRGFYSWLRHRGARMSNTFSAIRDWQEEALIFYQSKKLVEIAYDPLIDQRIVSVPAEKRLSLEFYKNNIIHFFLAPAMIALLRLRTRSRETLLVEFRRLKRMFRFDFVMPGAADEQELDAGLEYFRSEWDSNEETLKNFAGLIGNFLESYLVALHTLATLPAPFTTEKDFLERAQKVGEQMYKLREIDRLESLSRLNFQSALKWMRAEGWLKAEQDLLSLSPEAVRKADLEMAWIKSLLSSIRYF